MSLRITGGRFRGRQIAVFQRARPTQGRVREALFSRWGERIVGARFLDLFCAGGTVGIEALSRGAGSCLFVDRERGALAVLEENLRLLDAPEDSRWQRLDIGAEGWARSVAHHDHGPFDLVFVDPPYALAGLATTIASIVPMLAPDGEIAVEHGAAAAPEQGAAAPGADPRSAPPGGFTMVDRRRYGDTTISWYRGREDSDVAAAQEREGEAD